ncbi:MAG: FAD-dependent monooxygenase [Acetobacteraceae bacterium]
MSDVLVVGAGPVGLTMAAELARHGVRCRIIDRSVSPSPFCRAIGVTPRTLEVWEDMGVAREMIDAGLWLRGFRTIIHGQPTRDVLTDYTDLPYSELGLPQYATERVLTKHLAGFGLAVEHGVALEDLRQDADGVTVGLTRQGASAEDARFRYVIGCDGAHSAVRHALGIGFPGDAFPMMFMLGDVHIAIDLPRGLAVRAMRLVDNGAPDVFIAVPLPEPGRYRVSMMAPQTSTATAGTASDGTASDGVDHGIQSEARGPDLSELQAVVDRLLPDRPRLSDIRWSSRFRISMRLADRYRLGRVFIAGDAAHIHPPTGGQGMNTGIQDAYNLAWKLALVLRDAAPAALLDSYEAERRPVGADVVARTRAATESYGREAGPKPHRLTDSQVLVSYRGSAWVRDDDAPGALDAGGALDAAVPAAGDRAPDAAGLRRYGIGFPFRLFQVLRGTGHVLLAHVTGEDPAPLLADLAALAPRLGARVVAVCDVPGVAEFYGVAVLHDREGTFAAAYGTQDAGFLVRPDGYIGWRGASWRDQGLHRYAEDLGLSPARPPGS